jgi:hypothetical protein
MRIAHVILPAASQFERKSQRADSAALAEHHEVLVVTVEDVARSDARVAHVYASGELPRAPFAGFPIPYVSSVPMKTVRWELRRPVAPSRVISPLGDGAVPEVVEEAFFRSQLAVGGWQGNDRRDRRVIGSFARPAIRPMVEQTLSRIHRFRSDVDWILFDRAPTAADLAGVEIWVDPAVEENDFDGFTAEALVVGLPVVAARTAINSMRLEQGRTGWLVPPRDPNEMTHAILAALFKPEVARNKIEAARQTVSKFRARQRLRELFRIYETLSP